MTIVGNLLENAIKYSPRGGVIDCTVLEDGGSGVIKVRDDGVGIAPEDLPRLFNRFERLHNRETSDVGGTGLGLYLSRELARQHGGDLSVESKAHTGSTFTLRVPIATPRAEVGDSRREPAAQPAAEPARSAAEPPRLHVVNGNDADLTA